MGTRILFFAGITLFILMKAYCFDLKDIKKIVEKGEEAAKKVKKILDVADEVKELIYESAGDSGSVEIQGRTLQYRVTAQMYEGKWQYKGKAWDEVSQISVKTKAYESQDGAREHALEDLTAELRKLGHIK